MKKHKGLKVLFLDIEASDLKADIGHTLTIGYKWAHEKKPKILSLLDYPGKQVNDDTNLLKAYASIHNSADLIVHHFGDFYDIPFLQTRCLIKGLKILNDVRTIDTWRIAYKKLKFGNNRLNRILEALGCPYDKSPVKMSIWSDARVGIKKAFKYIIEHNYWDVMVLEWVYNKIKPVWSSHPRMYAKSDEVRCPLCNGNSKSHGRRLCKERLYQRRLCLKCGHAFKGSQVCYPD